MICTIKLTSRQLVTIITGLKTLTEGQGKTPYNSVLKSLQKQYEAKK